MQNKKSADNINSIKNNKKLRIFLLFLMLSFLFWMLIKLSKNYIADVEFNLTYTEIPQNKLLQNEPDKKIKLTINTIGFKLLGYSLKKRNLNYSLSEIKRKRGSEYYSLTKSNINFLQSQLSAETVVLNVIPDTLNFDFGVKKSKKVKIIPNITLEFKPGFNLIKNYNITPKNVTISGPTKIVDSINEINTEEIVWKDISESFENKIKLLIPHEGISLSTNEILVKGKVEKITQGSFNLPFKVINLPKNYIISTYPKEVKIIYQVALNDYNKISENSFKIQCDYKQTDENNLEYLIPVIVEKPEILFDVKIVPNKIEFLIKK